MSNKEYTINITRKTIIKKGGRSPFTAYGYFIQPHGTLEGQELRKFLGSYETLEETQAAHPDTPLSHELLEEKPDIGPCPAGYYNSDGGFYDAGEYWDEDDY